MDALPPQPQLMTVPEFLAREPGDGRRWQLVDGVPQAMVLPNRTQGALQSELGRLIGNHLADTGSAWSVICEPGVQPRILGALNVRTADLAVTATPYDEEEALLNGSVLLVEVLSPSNQAETWSNVWTYTTIPSVQEILVLHSAAVAADVIRRQPDGAWSDMPERVADGELVLDSIGFLVPLRRVYRTTRLA